jgi:hypothetical protein
VEFARLQGGQLDNGRFDDGVCRIFRRSLSRARPVRVARTATAAPESAMILNAHFISADGIRAMVDDNPDGFISVREAASH